MRQGCLWKRKTGSRPVSRGLKRKASYWGLCFAVAILLFSVVGCVAEPQEDAGAYLLYVPAEGPAAAGADAIAPLQTDLDVGETASLEEKATAVVKQILACGGDLWEGIELRSITIKGRRAYVDFSSSYSRLTGIQLSLADYCVTLSLTQLEGLSSVTITAGGRELSFRDSQVMMEKDVLLSTMEDVIQTVAVNLYFADENGQLVAEQRYLELYEGQTLAESIVEALLEGPQEQELHRVIPERFEVNGVRIENRVCTLSLPGSALETLPEDESQQRLILQSIAKTLYDRELIDELHIVVDGEECTHFGLVPTEEVQFRPMEES